MTRSAVLPVLALVLLGLLSGCSSTPVAPTPAAAQVASATHLIGVTGTVLLPELEYRSKFETFGVACVAGERSRDIAAGASVRVTAPDGQLLARTVLGEGTVRGNGSCGWSYTVHLRRAAHYRLQIAQRSPETYSRSEFLVEGGPIFAAGY